MVYILRVELFFPPSKYDDFGEIFTQKNPLYYFSPVFNFCHQLAQFTHTENVQQYSNLKIMSFFTQTSSIYEGR